MMNGCRVCYVENDVCFKVGSEVIMKQFQISSPAPAVTASASDFTHPKMTKVTSSKKNPSPAHKVNVVKQKPTLKPKKMGSEIDEIFAGKKRKRLEKENNFDIEKLTKVFAANSKSHDKTKRGKSSKNSALEENSSADLSSRLRKKTADGLAIYTEGELGVGKPDAGGTNMCPFDCDCCF
ncbi:hypothetical protein DH2020_040763 [Rehmannia glutinosa]|uniref:DUF1764-domain-containing protein n=1 Tax=Rehmannia glutinosa TaxID=99300 RepID=A0ABR0UTB3_REHGL